MHCQFDAVVHVDDDNADNEIISLVCIDNVAIIETLHANICVCVEELLHNSVAVDTTR